MVEEDEVRRQWYQSMVGHGTLILTVRVSTEDDARQIMEWMYSSRKPMSAELLEISWDKVAVPKQEAEALEVMSKALMR